MSYENNMMIPLSTIDTKMEVVLNKDEECDYYRQRYSRLQFVVEDFEKQLTMYKNRCLGVDTIFLTLKESKQQNVKLSKRVKGLETDISVLKKRLSKNGFSDSVNVQETELFVPGASKQTFDNLAKENARLRTLLKQENGHLLGTKSADEIEDMKTALEETESENAELKNKLKDMEAMKLQLINDYEGMVKNLKKEIQEEKLKHEELKASQTTLQEVNDKQEQCERISVGCQCQMNISGSSDVWELKDLLKQTVEKCSLLEGQLLISPSGDQANQEQCELEEKIPMVSQREFDQLLAKYNEAVSMNQKWQIFTKDREKQIQALNDRIQDLSDPLQMAAMVEEATKQKTAQWAIEFKKKDTEILQYHRKIQDLTNELTNVRRLQSKMHQENSTVEILKQQIQVCTEDFHTERRDREAAVQKARALQEESNRLKAEKSNLLQQIEQLKRSTEEQPQRQLGRPPTYEACVSTNYNSELPSPQLSSPNQGGSMSPRYGYHLVPVQESPGQSSTETLGPGPGMPFSDYQGSPASMVQESTSYKPPNGSNDIMKNYGSFPRQFPNYNMGSPTQPTSNTSMPSLMRRGGNVKDELTCPKCNQKFSDEVLLSHIDACKQ